MSKAGSNTGLTGPRASCFQDAETSRVGCLFWALKKTRGRNCIYRGVRGNEAVLFKLFIMEMGNEETAVDLMELEPVSRLKTQYRSLRRQLYFIQSICVLFCFTCCLFTIMYHSYPTACMVNGSKEPQALGMQYQAIDEMIPTQRMPFTRLRVNPDAFAREKKHVPWIDTEEENQSGYLKLDDDGVSLMVLRDGTYKVSLQITYRGVKEVNGTFTLQHDIYLDTKSYNEQLPLLTYMETVNFTSPYWRKSLFSEGIFFLEYGDRLKVLTTNLSLIDVGDKLPQKTVFVVYPHFST